MFYKQNGIVAGILLLILFAGAIGLVSVQMDKTVNRMHYSVVEEMGEYRTELIRQDFQKTAELNRQRKYKRKSTTIGSRNIRLISREIDISQIKTNL